jgi:MtaA/CmuA family methyltransferase
MSGRELIEKTFRLEKTPRTPWVPFVGCHGASLIGASATEYLQSPRLIVEGIGKAIELYRPDGIPVLFDLQVEAEALGCQLAWSDYNPPAVSSHVLLDGKSVSDLTVPLPADGRIPIAIDATRELRALYPDVALYGIITGPFTLAMHLQGTDIFMKMMEAPEEVQELMEFTTRVGKAMAKYFMDAGCDIIAVVDPMTSQIDPASFENFVHHPASEIFQSIRSKGRLSSFFVCGHAQQNIEAMCACKPDNISIDENIPLDYVRDIALKHKISFGGNIKLTVVLLMGTPDDAQRDALDCMDLAGKEGFVLSPGCDMPMDTPVENLQAITRLVNDEYLQDVVRTKEKSEINLALLNMKDYGMSNKVIIDIITLDSESCAPCQYMVQAVKRVVPHFEGLVEWREHAIKKLEGVTFMSSLLVKNIPTICIDGKIEFVSQIPPQQELIAAIQKRINQKFKLMISSRKAEILVMGSNQEECDLAKANIDMAMQETGKTIHVTTSTEPNVRATYGVVSTPAILFTEHKLKAQGEVPSVVVVKEWLKDLPV